MTMLHLTLSKIVSSTGWLEEKKIVALYGWLAEVAWHRAVILKLWVHACGCCLLVLLLLVSIMQHMEPLFWTQRSHQQSPVSQMTLQHRHIMCVIQTPAPFIDGGVEQQPYEDNTDMRQSASEKDLLRDALLLCCLVEHKVQINWTWSINWNVFSFLFFLLLLRSSLLRKNNF